MQLKQPPIADSTRKQVIPARKFQIARSSETPRETVLDTLKVYFRGYDREKARFEQSLQQLEKTEKFSEVATSYRVAIRLAAHQNANLDTVNKFFRGLLERDEIARGHQGIKLFNDYVKAIANNGFNVSNSLSNLLFSLEQNCAPEILELGVASAQVFKANSKEDAPPATHLTAFRKLSKAELLAAKKIIYFYNNNLTGEDEGDDIWRKDNPFSHLLSVLEFCDWSGNPKLNAINLKQIDSLRANAEPLGPQIKFLARQLVTSVEDRLIQEQLKMILDTPDPIEQRKHLELLKQLMGNVFPVVQHSNKPDPNFRRQSQIFNSALIAFRGFFDISAEIEMLAHDFKRHTPGELPVGAQFYTAIAEETSWLHCSRPETFPGQAVWVRGLKPEMLFEIGPDSNNPLAKYKSEWTWAKDELEPFLGISIIASEHLLILSNPNPDTFLRIPDSSNPHGFKAVPYSIVHYRKSMESQGVLSLLVPTAVIEDIATGSAYSILDIAPDKIPAVDTSLGGFSPVYLYARAAKLGFPVINTSTGANITGFDAGLEARTSPLHGWEAAFGDEVFFEKTYTGHVDKRALQVGKAQINGENKADILARLQTFHDQVTELVFNYRLDAQILLARLASWKYGQTPLTTESTLANFFEPIPQDLSAMRMIYESYAWHRYHRQQNSAMAEYPILSFHQIGDPKKLCPNITLDTYSMLLKIDGENLALPMPRELARYDDKQILHLLSDERVAMAWNTFVTSQLQGQMPVFLNRSTLKGD